MIRVTQPSMEQLASLSTVWAVMQAARAGAADASAAARGFLPAVSQAFTGGLHSAGFAVGFAVTFPAYLVARAVPQHNPLVYGLKDGGQAGLDLARSTVAAASAAPAPAPVLAIASA
ncbi:MAG: hypothetical protein EBZ74_04635 [Planctomycetia bacterium]|nr:hypothetical protein [Planctomycetia bacterium]